MNSPHQSPDPLLQSLSAEAADLPLRAAITARQRNAQKQRHRKWATIVTTVLILTVSFWLVFPSLAPRHSTVASSNPDSKGSSGPAPAVPKPEPSLSDHRNVVEMEIAKQNTPKPIPTGLSPEQMALVQAAGDLPLVILRDASGKATRILIVER
jgi:hypothetical protein